MHTCVGRSFLSVKSICKSFTHATGVLTSWVTSLQSMHTSSEQLQDATICQKSVGAGMWGPVQAFQGERAGAFVFGSRLSPSDDCIMQRRSQGAAQAQSKCHSREAEAGRHAMDILGQLPVGSK